MYQYNQVEEALAKAFCVPPNKRQALRARLQYLRRNGVPRVENTGTGFRVQFTEDHVSELALALELAANGFEPAEIVSNIRTLLHAIPPHVSDDWLLWLDRNKLSQHIKLIGMGTRYELLRHLPGLVDSQPRLVVMAVGHSIRKVMDALEGTLPASRGPSNIAA